MIRINLLGQARPRVRRKAVPLETTIQMSLLVAALVISFGYLTYDYYRKGIEIEQTQQDIRKRQEELAHLNQLKQEIATYQQQQAILQQRINVIEQLQQQRTGGQALLQAVATTVNRTETLWLTNLTRTGDALTIDGVAGSINAVANFITQLKRSGYFGKIDIKETHQDEAHKEYATFKFSLTAQVSAQAPAAGPGGPRKS